ncbi:MAG: hypothetical protein II664_01190 [Oscillospiraceae bacterium]|nr:hypothetical protein [Oscillospiraceae bacterium]
MKKIVSSAVAAAVALSAAAVPVCAAEKGSLLVMGDSITSGYGLDGYVSGDNTSAKDSFANILSADYEDYTNLAVDGRTTAELLEAVTSDEDFQSAIADADDIVISIGGNDVLMPMLTSAQSIMTEDEEFLSLVADGTITADNILTEVYTRFGPQIVESIKDIDYSVTAENISGIFDNVQDINSDCDIYILTLYDPFEGWDVVPELSEASVASTAAINECITSAAASHENVYVVDVGEAFKGNAEKYTNIGKADVHPSKDGHKLISELIAEAMDANSASDEEEPVAETEEEAAEEEAAEDEASAEDEAPAEDEASAEDEAPAEDAAEEAAPAEAPASDSVTDSASTGNAPAGAMAAVAAVALSAAFMTVRRKK